MTSRFLIESFWQNGANCVSVVLIKAAILRYGMNGIFKTERRRNNFIITLKDERILTLNDTAIQRINRKNKIAFRRLRDKKRKADINKLKKLVSLCFAVIVRNVHIHGYNGVEHTESSAIKELTKEGVETDHMHSLLGLSRKSSPAKKLSIKHLISFKRKKAVLLFSTNHIVVVSRGYYEDFGYAVKIKNKIPIFRGKKAKAWFELK
jgi:hypothetical protein